MTNDLLLVACALAFKVLCMTAAYLYGAVKFKSLRWF